MQKVKEFLGVFLSALFLFGIFLWVVFPSGLANLDTTFFSATHDGIKNYFTFLHYLKYESGFLFKGMAYPYQDLITFTDNQPLLVLVLKQLGAPHTISLGAALAIFNALLLLALPLSVYFLYKIVRHYGVASYPAFFFAFVIALLAPQNERIFGHYGLAYSFFIPVLWYLTIQYIQAPKAKYLLTAIGFVFMMCFLHVYYLAIALVFFGFTALGYFVLNRNNLKHTWKQTSYILLMGIAPILLFKVFMWQLDTKTDRVEIPWGFLNYRATFRSIFFTPDSPFDALIPDALQAGKYESEGDAYLSIMGLFFAAFVVYVTVKNWVRTKTFSLNLIEIPGYSLFIYTGVFAYIFAAVFPFYMPPLDYFIQFLKPLLQFRSPGRFAWIFYYVFTVFMLLYFYRKALLAPTQFKKWVFYIPAILMLADGIAIEAKWFKAVNHHNEGKAFLQSEWPAVIKKYQLDTAHYSAMIALPFFTIGNEKAGFGGSEKSIFNAMAITYHSGLPMVNYMMSRTSVSEGLKIAGIISHPVLPKLYFNQFNGPKPFLLMVAPDALSAFEQAFIGNAQHMFTHNKFEFYQVFADTIVNRYARYNDSINSVPLYETKDPLLFISKPKLGFFKHDNYVGLNPLTNFEEHESYREGKHTLYEGPISCQDSVVISFWTRSKTAMNGFAVLRITEKDEKGNIVYHYNSHLEPYPEIYMSARRIAHTYKPKSSNHTVLIEAEGKMYNLASFLIYELPNNVYYSTNDELVLWNNYPLDVEKMYTIIKP